LILAVINSAEYAVADRVCDVEVVTGHQGLIVVIDVVLSQTTHERQSTGP
jgi:HD-like signal output (HDOD) protein